jgi:peptide/nickel transport system substrate-binding protein
MAPNQPLEGGTVFKTMRRASAVLIVASLVAAGCGAGDDASQPDTEDDASPSDTASEPTATTAPESEDDPEEPAPTTEQPEDDGPAAPDGVDRDAALTYGVLAMASALDPHFERSANDRPALWSLYDRLLMMDNERQIVAGIATDWAFSDDGLELTLGLREGVTFHDGTPVDATAAKASLDRAMTLEGSTAAPHLDSIEEVIAVDDTTLRITLEEPSPFILSTLATSAGALISPAAIAEGSDLDLGPNGANSGPYDVADFVPDQVIVLERVDAEYWDPDAAQVKTLTLRAYEQTAALAAVQAGDADVVFARGELDYLREIGENPEIDFVNTLSAAFMSLVLNNELEPLQDPNVRAAIAHAIPRQMISETITAGECYFNPQGFPEISDAYRDGYDPFPYDPDLARELFAEAGVTEFDMPMLINIGHGLTDKVVLALQSELEKVGVSVSLNPVPVGEILQAWNSRSWPAYMGPVVMADDDYTFINRMYFGIYNLAGGDADTVRQALDSLSDPALGPDERGAVHQQAAETVLELGTMIPICNTNVSFMVRPHVLNVDTMPGAWAGQGNADPRYLAVAAD